MARGNSRRDIVRDDEDPYWLVHDLERTIMPADWEVLAAFLMSSSRHLLTPRPVLAWGTQAFLST